MQVRKATEDDLVRIHNVLCRNFDEIMAKQMSEDVVAKFHEINSLENLANQLQWKTIYVSEENGEVTGTGAFANLGVVAYPKYTVSNLCVLPEKQGLGIGSMIFDKLLDDAKRSGVPDFHALAAGNSINFFLKKGFVVAGEQPQSNEGITWLIMAL